MLTIQMNILIFLLLLIANCEEVVIPIDKLAGNFASLISWRSDCAQQALKELIPQCINQGIESITHAQQKSIALQLSICQFEDSGVIYPSQCRGDNLDIEQCILSLERRAQYWTTYSGYYQDIKNICHQISLPFEKDQILGIYENITRIYHDLYDDMVKSQDYSKEIQKSIKIKFKEMFDVIDHIFDQTQKQYKQESNRVQKEWNKFQKELKHNMNNTLVVLEYTYNGINTNINHVNKHLEYFINQMSDIYDLTEKQNGQQQSIISNNKHIMKQQGSIINSAKSTSQGIDVIMKHIEFGLLNLNQEILTQTSIINHQTQTMLFELTQSLTIRAKDLVESFELILNESINNLETKLKSTDDIINSISLKLGHLANMLDVITNIKNKLTHFITGLFSILINHFYLIVTLSIIIIISRIIVNFSSKLLSPVSGVSSIIKLVKSLLKGEIILLLISSILGIGIALLVIHLISR